jgi:hypothetical protein
MTSKQAQLIVEAHEIMQLLDDGEEVDLLLKNNPELYEAYVALRILAEA